VDGGPPAEQRRVERVGGHGQKHQHVSCVRNQRDDGERVAPGEDRDDAGQGHGDSAERQHAGTLSEEQIGEQDDQHGQCRLQEQGVDGRRGAEPDIDQRIERCDADGGQKQQHAPVPQQNRPLAAQVRDREADDDQERAGPAEEGQCDRRHIGMHRTPQDEVPGPKQDGKDEQDVGSIDQAPRPRRSACTTAL